MGVVTISEPAASALHKLSTHSSLLLATEPRMHLSVNDYSAYITLQPTSSLTMLDTVEQLSVLLT